MSGSFAEGKNKCIHLPAQTTDGTQEPGPAEHPEASDSSQESDPASLQLEGSSGSGSKETQETEKPYNSLCLVQFVTLLICYII